MALDMRMEIRFFDCEAPLRARLAYCGSHQRRTGVLKNPLILRKIQPQYAGFATASLWETKRGCPKRGAALPIFKEA